MYDPITTLESDAKAELIHGEALLAPAAADIKALFANRLNDVVLIAVVLASVWIGHAL